MANYIVKAQTSKSRIYETRFEPYTLVHQSISNCDMNV